jgi:U32 family peptidase
MADFKEEKMLTRVACIQHLSDITLAKSFGVEEIILSPVEISRTGSIPLSKISVFCEEALKNHLKVSVDWDILMTENEFLKQQKIISELPFKYISALRVQDVGAINWLMENYPDLKIQPVLETGHHNQEAIKTYIQKLGSRLDRVILSSELPKEILESFKKLNCEIEILLLGRIQLFYTPRNLLSPLSEMSHDEWTATGESEESPHRGFPIVQNRHGTFMYHLKDLCLLTVLTELEALEPFTGRVDVRHQKNAKVFEVALAYLQKPEATLLDGLKRLYTGEWMKGFFAVNKTDVLFPKLKNIRLQRHDHQYMGEVVDVIKDQAIIIQLRERSLKVGQMIRFCSPLGVEKNVEVRSLKDHDLNQVEEARAHSIAILPFVRGMTAQSVLYLDQGLN